jgi:hypothetical protein
VWLRREVNVTSLRSLFLCSVCNSVGVFDTGERGEAVGHWVAHIHAFSDFLDLQFQSPYPVGKVVDCVDLSFPVCSGVILFDFAGGSLRRQLVRIAEVFGEVLLEFSHCLIVLLDQLGQVLDIAANHGSGDIVSLFGRVDQFRNPSVGSGRVGKVGELGCDQLKFQAKGYFTYQQCPRMKAGLVLRAFEVCAPQLVDYPVVPPNEAADGDLDEVSEENVGPEFTSTNVLRRELHERRNVAVLVVKIASSNDTNGDQDTAANDTENNEDIPYHPQEPQEEDRIQPNLIHKLLLF